MDRRICELEVDLGSVRGERLAVKLILLIH